MIVKDLFDKIDFETLWNYYYEHKMKSEDDTLEKIENCKLSHLSAYLKIKKIKPIKNNNDILIFYKYIDDLDNKYYEYDDVSLFYLNEIKNNFYIVNEFEKNFDFSNFSFKEIRDFLINKTPSITSYAFEFSKWEEILGFNVDIKSMKNLGEVASLASVFYEMTFCGFDEEDIQADFEEIIDRADEVEEMIENNDFSKLKTLDEFFPELKNYVITDEDRKLSYLKNIENKKRIYFILKDILETNYF